MNSIKFAMINNKKNDMNLILPITFNKLLLMNHY